ncbi:Ppx/GppA phosphatase family protein [Rhodohalobacter sulfatireducens]|uniref:Ppx/GppA family phosphatase n=1 Tax=Rhodohalobacter sulfatireducens TaxID=2911366 RepID=A0ABS9KA74_9BACT|nr:Ppx/GppA phosphatase family protein [Rhodohalobacter sulfatireducens]MCG2587718.1 Ppx/GppA family phosphatase [Rhodohalobacter sulfatireducens]
MPEIYQTKPVKRIAAIDIGTNSFHAVIVDVYPDGSFYTIDKLKEMVLLAEKGFDNRLSDGAFQRALDALHKIKTLCDHQGAEKIMAYATSAIREAENGGELIQRVIDDVGVKIVAIPGRVEAELIGLAVQHGVEMSNSPSLIMDVGGGSVEYIIANNEKFFHLSSKKLGVARMTARFVDNDPISDEEIQALTTHFRTNLTDVAQSFASNRASMMIGSSGTMENIALMIAYRKEKTPNLSVNELEFTAAEFFNLYDDVIGMDYDERAELKGLDDKRVSLLPAGLVLVNYVLKTFGIKRVKISSQALREGIILRYLNQEMTYLQETEFIESPRRRSVLELVHKCNWHEQHSRHVAKLALQLFDHFQKEFDLEDVDRELLEYACFMHDIGYHISHRKHHKHALYIIRNSDLKGFKENEIEIMANVSRYHRRSTPKSRHKHYDKLPKAEKQRVKKLSAIMRIADGLDRSHYQNVQGMTIEKTADQVIINIKTESDPQLEIWGAMRKNALFEEVTGRTLKIQKAEKFSPAMV